MVELWVSVTPGDNAKFRPPSAPLGVVGCSVSLNVAAWAGGECSSGECSSADRLARLFRLASVFCFHASSAVRGIRKRGDTAGTLPLSLKGSSKSLNVALPPSPRPCRHHHRSHLLRDHRRQHLHSRLSLTQGQARLRPSNFALLKGASARLASPPTDDGLA